MKTRIEILMLITILVALLSSSTLLAWIDDFEDGDAKGWTPTGRGAWKIEKGGYCAQLVDTWEESFLEESKDWTDYTIETKCILYAGRVMGIYFRFQDTMNNYRLNLYDNHDDTFNFYIYKRDAGAYTETAKVALGKIDPNKWYVIKAEIYGDSFKGYLNGELKIEGADKRFKKGGIAVGGESATNACFDYVSAEGEGIPKSFPVESKNILTTTWANIKKGEPQK